MSANFPDALTYTKINATATTLTGAAGKYVRIWELLIAPTASTTLDISSPAATSLTGTMTMTGLYQGRSIAPHWVGAVSQDVVITVGANGAGQVVWSLEG